MGFAIIHNKSLGNFPVESNIDGDEAQLGFVAGNSFPAIVYFSVLTIFTDTIGGWNV